MPTPIVDNLVELHTAAIDARNGYNEALKDADGKGMTPLFKEMIGIHETNANELAAELKSNGQVPDDSGSFMSTVHRTIMDVRSLFNGLDESVLPGLIDGEKRNVAKYDDAIKDNDSKLLTSQRARLQQKISEMATLKT